MAPSEEVGGEEVAFFEEKNGGDDIGLPNSEPVGNDFFRRDRSNCFSGKRLAGTIIWEPDPACETSGDE